MSYKLKKNDLFYISWILMVVHLCLANSNAANFSTALISYFCMIIFFIKIIWTGHYTLKQIIVMCFLLGVSILSVIKCKDMRFFWFALVLCASKGIEFDRVVKYSLRTTIICCFCFMALYFGGIIEGAHSVSARGTRLSFGLGHANMCSAYYAIIIVYLLYLHFEKVEFKHILLIGVGAFVVFHFTKSNTGLLVTLFSIFAFGVLKYIPLKKFNSKIMIAVLLIVIAMFTIMPLLYNNSLLWLDTAMTGRLHQANFYFNKYGISIWGNDLSFDLNKWNTDNILDLGYARMLLCNGVMYYLLVVIGYVISLVKALKKQKRNLLVFLGAMIIYIATENVATYIFMNASMLVFSNIIFYSERKELGRKYES